MSQKMPVSMYVCISYCRDLQIRHAVFSICHSVCGQAERGVRAIHNFYINDALHQANLLSLCGIITHKHIKAFVHMDV